MINNDYRSNPDILRYIDTLNITILQARVVVLDRYDRPLRAIEGQTTAGSINLNGSSAVRRSGSLTIVTELNQDPTANPLDILNEVTNIETLIAMNKRCSIEIGIDNTGFEYREYNTFWIPIGIYVIKEAAVSHDLSNGIQVSLTLGDKMSLLNGDCGGTIPAAIDHSPIDVYVSEDKVIKEPVLFNKLIYELVTEIGEIDPEKVIISDVPDTIENIIRWSGSESLYIFPMAGDELQYIASLTAVAGAKEYKFCDSIGYMVTDFTYPTEETLSSNYGETVVSVLDKIKNKLGNFEYFFDIDGMFHFQAIRNYLNEGSSIDNLAEAINDKYLINLSGGKSLFSFQGIDLISAFKNNPQYSSIKNDLTVWGKKGDTKDALRYHLIIDTPPKAGNWYLFDTYEENGVIKARNVKSVEPNTVGAVQTDDWRNELYLYNLANNIDSLLSKEMKGSWPRIYDITFSRATKISPDASGFFSVDSPDAIDYYLDMIDPRIIMGDALTQPMKGLGVDTIGRRTHSFSDDNVNCIFAPKTPEILFIKETDIDKAKKIEECRVKKQKFLILNEALEEFIEIGQFYNSAYDLIRSALHEYTSYNNNINLTSLPVYHLEPNMRITVEDDASSIHGDYVINTISLPLTLNGTMSINAKKAIERI